MSYVSTENHQKAIRCNVGQSKSRGQKRKRPEVGKEFYVEPRVTKRQKYSSDSKRRSLLFRNSLKGSQPGGDRLKESQPDSHNSSNELPKLDRSFSFGEIQFQPFVGFNVDKEVKSPQKGIDVQFSVSQKENMKNSGNSKSTDSNLHDVDSPKPKTK